MIISGNKPLVGDSVGHRLDGLFKINCYKTQVCVVFRTHPHPTIVCFSCGKPGHGVGRCPELDETFPYMLPGWSVELGGKGGRQIRGEGSAAGISNELRPPDPGGGICLVGSRARMSAPPVDAYDHGSIGEGHVCFPLSQGFVERPVPRPACSRST